MASSVVAPRFARVAAVAALAAGAWLGIAGVANADAPQSGDDRATAYAGNARPGDCAGAGLAGERILGEDNPRGTYFDITSIPAGYTVTGVVVKGGDAYNVYLPGALGDLPWLKLHAPINASGGPAGLSHWFACGTKGSTTTTTTTAPVTTTTSPGGGESSTTVTTSPGGGAGSPSATTPGAQGGEGLASTGFGNGWLVIVGGALLLGGGALLVLVRGRSVAAARRKV
ncbi:LPXTG cell wall anchor domain-containing protein [Labedaea rhizosphaerae]|uniref:LPXTG-motif cell wall-anchored protein n=1 Tax=Labedaea rhizosphaerae TaxID=598644 RepID=A0A4R6SPE0_LABRH|nr:LPXTG cell wall anchor domain-containing protein [Labedaea rhizosphaerae]TDQ05917.1 LPXTG-motif cell wall-anchored protein [Labedaea rhizosphaerae]